MTGKSTANPPKVALVDTDWLSASRSTVEAEIAVSDMPELVRCLADDKGVFSAALMGTKGAKGYPGAILSVKGFVNMSCVRCGKPVIVEIDREVPFLFVPSERHANAMPIEDDEGYEIVPGSKEFDLTGLVQEEVILSLPAYPRHAHCQSEPSEPGSKEEMRKFPFEKLKQMLH